MCSTDPLTLATWITLLQEANRGHRQVERRLLLLEA